MSKSDTNPLSAVSSPDINAERLAELKRLFPDLFSNEGRLNIDELKKIVDPALVTESERYDFRWYGKTSSKREAFTPSRAALVYDPERSVNPDKAGGNMIIEGENLEVLKLLNCAYRERIKCIYIDPPYNTGKDFVYSDRFAEGQKPYWEQTGVTDGGIKVDSNSDSDGRFHSNWLSMMHSRLLAARYLLRPDGVIFVSIDDRELINLVKVMSEVFGEENHIATFVRRRRLATGMSNNPVSPDHEYIVAYARQIETLKLRGFDRRASDFPFSDVKSKYRSTDLTVGMTKEMRPNQYYAIKSTSDGTEYWPPEERVWRFEPTSMQLEIDGENIIWPDSSANSRMSRPRYKTRFAIDDGETNPVSTWVQAKGGDRLPNDLSGWTAGLNTEATQELRDILGDQLLEYPKPVSLIRDLAFVATQQGEIILDFFAGSGTTAQAVMELNKADGGNRQFILVQLPEIIAENSPAFKAGFKKISDITVERAKRVVMKIQQEAEGLFPSDPQRQFADSLGFKVYKLAKSVFPRVDFTPDPEKAEDVNVELLQKYIADKEQSFLFQLEKEKVRDEVLLKQGFMLDYSITPQPEFTKNEVVLIRDSHKQSLLCLDLAIAPETVDYFQNHNDHFFICLELALDTTKKWNLKHHLADKLKAI